MEKPFNKQNDPLKQWMQEVPLESPSHDFTKKVMQGITAKSTVTQFKPLIPKWAWWLIGIVLTASVVFLYFNPKSSLISLETATLFENVSLNNPFERLVLPKSAVYAIGFMALFLLQIPFLKKLHEKQLQ